MSFHAAQVVHAAMPPHEPDGYTSVSQPFAIGVSFTGHTKAVIETNPGRSSELSFPAGTCGIGGGCPTSWLRVREPSEALEIYPSRAGLSSVARETDIDWKEHDEYIQPGQDPVIWGTCARFRMAALGTAPIGELEADVLIHSLLVHVAVRHLGARPLRRARRRLDQRRFARVIALIESSLQQPPSLKEMADVAALSPFHFHQLFRATTGLSPHAYVMARRMERAQRMLAEPGTTVANVAAKLGFSHLAHFRRSFRRQFNTTPRGRGSA